MEYLLLEKYRLIKIIFYFPTVTILPNRTVLFSSLCQRAAQDDRQSTAHNRSSMVHLDRAGNHINFRRFIL